MSAQTDNKTRAKAMLRDELKKLRGNGWIDPRDRKITIGQLVAELAEHYEGKKMARFAKDIKSRWKLHLMAKFEHVPVHALTTKMQSEYKAARFARKDPPAHATVHRELQVLRRAYKLAAECEPPKVARVPRFLIDREDNAVKEFFTASQMTKIRAAASHKGQEWRALVELAYALGWRRGELLGLHVANLDLLAGTVRLDTSKTREPREAVLTPTLCGFVRPLRVNRAADDRVFSFDGDSFRYGWRRIAKAADVKKFYSFRRTSARDKRAAGIDSSIIMSVQGWKTDAMFRRYAITTRQDKLDAQRKLDEYQSQTRTKDGQFQGPFDVTH